MLSYLARRLAYALLTFFGITVVTFVLIHAVPGDPVTFYISRGSGEMSRPALDQLRHEYHLDEPLPAQYVRWLRGAVTFDFGTSTVDRQPVRSRIAAKLPNTFLLNLIAFVLAAGIGVPIGLWSARRSGSTAERSVAVVSFVLYSLPAFWVALLLMHWLAVRWNLLPLFGMFSDDYAQMPAAAKVSDRLAHLTLPVITLAYAQLAIFARFSKAALTEVITQDFITTARAKGAGPGAVLWHHAFRNALIPLVTLLGLTIPSLLSGSVIVESIFQWDGIGRLYYDSIFARDYPTVLALTVVTAVVTLAASVLADVLYAIVDPRVRLTTERR